MDSTVDVDDIILESPTSQFGRVVVLTGVAAFCKFTLQFMNRTTIRNEAAIAAIHEREGGRALITVANHTSTLDDPCIPCTFLPLSFFMSEANHEKTRWVYCAEDVCFKNTLLKTFFQTGKGLPITRGAGLEQPSMAVLAKRLGTRGDWLHVFPEGRISYDGKISDLRWGIGRMVCDVMKHSDGKSPVVLPYYHSGMGDVMPYKARFPRPGHNVTVTFGDPVDLDDLTCRCNQECEDQQEVWRDITKRVGDTLKGLEGRSVTNVDQTKSGAAPKHAHKRRQDDDF